MENTVTKIKYQRRSIQTDTTFPAGILQKKKNYKALGYIISKAF
jgi:hypothetical protein